MKPAIIVGAALTAGALALLGHPALSAVKAMVAQDGIEASARQEACQERDWGELERVCEVREITIAAPPGALRIDGGMNGGVRVVGESRTDVLAVAEVWAASSDAARARELLDRVALRSDGGTLASDGPETARRESWGVSWRVYVPTESDLDVETHNGGVSISDVEGRVRFDALNGGVSLSGLGGDVRGRTVNGGLSVALSGPRWDGAGLDVRTTNGGVELMMAEGYSADFETGTVNGRIDTEIPMQVQGRITRTLRTQLGEGGPSIRVATTNGSVRIRSY